MPNDAAYRREEETLEQALADGIISLKEFNKQMGDIQRDYRDACREEAEAAYDRAMEQY